MGARILFIVCILSSLAAYPQTVLSNSRLSLEMENGAFARLTDQQTGAVLLRWVADSPGWHFSVRGDYTPVSPGKPVKVESPEGGPLRLTYLREEYPAVAGVLTVSLRDDTIMELALHVENRSDQEIDIISFPSGLVEPGGAERYLVYPYQSGALLPLDARFDRIRIYDALPFVLGYPSNVMSMQWMGVQWPEASVMLMSTDRYGALKRMGAQRGTSGIQLVCEFSACLRPGGTFDLPPVRIVATGKDGYEAMASVYRDWVGERTSASGEVLRDTVDGMEKVPLQFVPIEARRTLRPGLDRLKRTHGFPEHAIRGKGEEAFPYMPYGTVVGMMRAFEETYGSKVIPQLWSFSQSGDDGGWPLLPVDARAESAHTIGDMTFPALDFRAFVDAVHERDDGVILYTNPTFIGQASPDYDPSRLFDTSGKGDIRMGGLAAQASEDSAYVSPSLVMDYQAAQLAGVLALGGGRVTGAIMYDSSQALGGTLFNNSLLRRDALTDIDRNPAARYVERYGYEGRDSYVQDRLKRDLALHAVSPRECKSGEWASELTSMYLDLNAGSICLKREYPDGLERADQLIPVPLFQMVYGDTQVFTIRVGAASDADMGRDDPANGIPAEMSRRGTALFGGVHQVLYWGGVPWAGPAYGVFHGRTYLVTRDNLARESLFGKRAGFRMLNATGKPTVDNFCVRETRWFDAGGRVLGWHYDNNGGSMARVGDSGTEGPAIDALWGEDTLLPQSLGRLKSGGTITLTSGGHFVLWDFAGKIAWPGNDGECTLSIGESAGDPEGLAVIWDGACLSFGNASKDAREVTLTVRGAMPDGGQLSPARDEASGSYEAVFIKGAWRVRAALPPAPERTDAAPPTVVLSLGHAE